MSLGSLLALLVVVFAAIALLGKVEINPWWGVLALAIAVLLGGLTFPVINRRI
jgi:hypothetical protein